MQKATTRNCTARQLIDELAATTAVAAVPAEIWQHLAVAFADTPALAAEIACLRTSLARTRLSHANLAAAALASIAAHADGESDPLCYLRDELGAQGHHVGRSWR